MTETILSTPSPSVSRLTKLGFGLGLKPGASPASPSHRTDQDDDDWYIPYNGPYEKPKDKGKERERGSWGDLLDVQDNSNPIGMSKRSSELIFDHTALSNSSTDNDERRGRSRSRALSGISRFTTTSGGSAFDRWSVVSSSQPVSPSSRFGSHGKKAGTPSFLNLDLSATGIGESPVPKQRVYSSSSRPSSTVDSMVANRGSFASFWTFGQNSTKRSPPSSVAQNQQPEQWPRPSTSTQHTTVSRRERAATVGASERKMETLSKTAAEIFPGSHRLKPSNYYPQPSHTHVPYVDEPIASTSKSPPQPEPTNHAPHPYAVAFPSYEHIEETDSHRHHPTVTLITPPARPLRKKPSHLQSSNPNSLRSSISTPNLRAMSLRQTDTARPPPSRSASWMDKWLSAETCFDAFLFPRPRLRVNQALSPPPSPILETSAIHGTSAAHNQTGSQRSLRPPSTRTLKKKVSKIGLFLQGQKSPRDSPISTAPSNPDNTVPEISTVSNYERPPRPKSFAMDDLALLSPVPSLMRVLKEGDVLEKERADWNRLATHSFQNKRSRSLSRTRLKSLVSGNMQRQLAMEKERKALELAESFNLLASYAFHGHQAKKPSISEPSSVSGSGNGTMSRIGTVNGGGTVSSSDHSRKSSNVSQPRSRGHAHKESWSKTALKTAKATVNAAGLCTFPDDVSSAPPDERSMAIENALSREDTQIIKFGERELERQRNVNEHVPSVVLISSQPTTQRLGPPPIVTDRIQTASDQNKDAHEALVVGIAVSTPSTTAENQLSLPDHPYANETLLSHETPRSEYAGPHPVHVQITDMSVSVVKPNDVSSRHRLPPRPQVPILNVTTTNHPYASPEVIKNLSPLDLPLHSARSADRMYAQVSSGRIRQVESSEFQYSPLGTKSDEFKYLQPHRSSSIGIEEVLNTAFGHSQDNDADEAEIEQNSYHHPYQTSIPSSEVLKRSPSSNTDFTKLSQMPKHLRMPSSQETSPSQISSISPQREATSQDSSPKGSPGIFRMNDDFDKYSDLFYKPAKQSGDSLKRQQSSADVLSQSPERKDSASSKRPDALRNLSRQLSVEFGIKSDASPRDESEPLTWGRGVKGLADEQHDFERIARTLVPRISTDTSDAFPLRLPGSRPRDSQPSLLVPEDISASRRSSLMDEIPGSDDGDNDQTVIYRVGEVPALSTPNPINDSPHRFSRQALYVDSDPGSLSPRDSYNLSSPVGPNRLHHSSAALSPLTPLYSVSDVTRASYVTSTSSNSRISHLSDFPAPPELNAMPANPYNRSHSPTRASLVVDDNHGNVGRI